MRAILLTSSVLILALILLRTLLRGHISLRLQYALWLLVAVRLLVPFELGQSAFSILSLADRAQETPAVQAIETVGELSLPAQSFEDAYAQVVEEYESRGIDVGSLTGSDREALDYEAQSRMAGPTLPSFSPLLPAGSIWRGPLPWQPGSWPPMHASAGYCAAGRSRRLSPAAPCQSLWWKGFPPPVSLGCCARPST